MKIRNGFVSNSSSSSFCIMGIELDRCEFIDLIEKSGYNLKDYIDKEDFTRYDNNVDDYFDHNGYYEVLDNFIEKEFKDTNISYRSGDEYCYIGRDYFTGKPDETFKQFRDTTIKDLNKLFKNNIEESQVVLMDDIIISD